MGKLTGAKHAFFTSTQFLWPFLVSQDANIHRLKKQEHIYLTKTLLMKQVTWAAFRLIKLVSNFTPWFWEIIALAHRSYLLGDDMPWVSKEGVEYALIVACGVDHFTFQLPAIDNTPMMSHLCDWRCNKPIETSPLGLLFHFNYLLTVRWWRPK